MACILSYVCGRRKQSDGDFYSVPIDGEVHISNAARSRKPFSCAREKDTLPRTAYLFVNQKFRRFARSAPPPVSTLPLPHREDPSCVLPTITICNDAFWDPRVTGPDKLTSLTRRSRRRDLISAELPVPRESCILMTHTAKNFNFTNALYNKGKCRAYSASLTLTGSITSVPRDDLHSIRSPAVPEHSVRLRK